jgi:hypothetical protein
MAAITSAVVGVVGAGVSIGMSVSQANKAAADRRKAQKQAKKAMEEARRETEIMPMQELSLNLAAYEQSREAQQRGVQQVMSQAALDPRQAAAVGGRAMMAGIEAERGIRASQAKETLDLEKIKATERAEASEARKELALGEAEGAQAAAADARARQTAATQAAVQAGVEGLGSAMNLYSAVQGPFDRTSMDYMSSSGVTGSDLSSFQQGGYTFGMTPQNTGFSQSSVQSSNLNSQTQPYLDPVTNQLINPVTGLPIFRP